MVVKRFRPPRDQSSERRIAEEVFQGDASAAVKPEECWYRYLQQKLRFPFAAKCIPYGDTSPLYPGSVVSVLGLAKQEHCTPEVQVRVMDGQSSVLVRLQLLTAIGEDVEVNNAVNDWRYWPSHKNG
jgi:hypothetical protein